MSIRTRMLLTLIPVILIGLGLLTYTSLRFGRNQIISEIESRRQDLTHSYPAQFGQIALSAQTVAEDLATLVARSSHLDDASIRASMKDILERNRDVYGSTVSLAAGATRLGAYAPYYYRAPDGSFRYKNLVGPSYAYEKWEWFQEPQREGHGIWIEPYFDKGGGDILMTTYSTPIVRNGVPVGVATVDLSLNYLVKQLSTLNTGAGGLAFIVSKKGYMVAHPNQKLLSATSLWENSNLGNPDLRKLAGLIKHQRSDASEMIYPFTGIKSWVLTMPIPSTEWTLVAVYPSNEVNAPFYQMYWILGGTGLLLALILVVAAIRISGSVTSPISRLVAQTDRYAGGDFGGRLDEAKGPREIRRLSRAFNAMGQEIERELQELKDTQQEVVFRLGLAAEYRDSDTGSHIRRMSHYCAALARARGLDEKECAILLHAAPMHDIGKIGIPDSILLKPGKLETGEFEVMKTHAAIGDSILSGGSSALLQMAQEVAATHHERWDGTGYPRGLKGEAIPIWGRIACICDVFDSLTTQRPYKSAWTVEESLKEIERLSGKSFDPGLVELFKRILPEILEIRQRFSEEQLESVGAHTGGAIK